VSASLEESFLKSLTPIRNSEDKLPLFGFRQFVMNLANDLSQCSTTRVDKVRSRQIPDKTYARKRLSKKAYFKGDKSIMKAYQKELEALKGLRHDHLVTVEGSYTDKKWLALLLNPVADLNLKQYLQRDGGIPMNEVEHFKTYFGCLAHTLWYLRDQKIQHKDIKPENVLLKQSPEGYRLFLTDFGTAWNWAASGQSVSLPSHDDRKTPSYQSPEVANGTECHFSSDIWSLGVVYLEMTTVLRGRAFKDMGVFCTKTGTGNSTVWNNLEGALQWLDVVEPKLRHHSPDTGLRKWIRAMLVEMPALRISVQALCEDIDDFKEEKYCGRCCSGDESSENSETSLDTHDAVEEAAEPTREEPITVRLVDRVPHSQTVKSFANEVARKVGLLPFTVSFRDRKVQMAVTHSPVYSQYAAVDSVPKQDKAVRENESAKVDTGAAMDPQYDKKKDIPDPVEPRLADSSRMDHFFESLQFAAGPAHDSLPGEENAEVSATTLVETRPAHDSLPDEKNAEVSATTLVETRPALYLDGPRRAKSLSNLRATMHVKQQGYDDVMESEAAISQIVHYPSDSALNAAFKMSKDTLRQTFEELKMLADKPRPGSLTSDPLPVLGSTLNEPKPQAEPTLPIEKPEDVERVSSPPPRAPPTLIGTRSPAAETLQQSLSHARVPSAANRTPLTAANLRALPNSSGAVRPGKAKSYRERLLSDVARAAPTTVLSAATRHRLSTFKPLLHLNDRCYGFLERYTELGKVAAVRYVLEAGCNPGVREKPRLTPLFNTIRGASERHTKCLLTLVEHKVDTNPFRPSNKPSPLLVAVGNKSWTQYATVIYILLQAGADPNALDETKASALTLLLRGSIPLSKERRDAVHLLLAPNYNTDLSIQSPMKGNTALHLAIRRCDPEIVDAIFDRIDVIKTKAERRALINQHNKAGLTPLRLAYEVFHSTAVGDRVRADQEEIVEMLLRYDADPNATDQSDCNTPLHIALSSNASTLGLVTLLLEKNANLYMRNTAGKTPSSIIVERLNDAIRGDFYFAVAVEVAKLHAKTEAGGDSEAAPGMELCACDVCLAVRQRSHM
jgi:serine/threonine protein kinase/ankyrin repeat protein